ncbi:MAG: tRNA (adenosine(37)-N6)-dimethylallyltransferase MiaA [Rhodobacterales bacterium]
MDWLKQIQPNQPILLAGPTASGKSAMALEIAARFDGIVVNADALQVYDCWQVLTARPSATDLAQALHLLYGHVGRDQAYSVGHWLREVTEILKTTPNRSVIITGGTGLYFTALVDGLAEIPEIDAATRNLANQRMNDAGHTGLLDDLIASDPKTVARIDTLNPVRIQRAWEVYTATGKGLADWQDSTPPPLLPLLPSNAFVLNAPKEWLTPRINTRFDTMLERGALAECRANLPNWNSQSAAAKAIGAAELMSYLKGDITLPQAIEAATIATRQYAKRQRSWFRARLKNWTWIDAT